MKLYSKLLFQTFYAVILTVFIGFLFSGCKKVSVTDNHEDILVITLHDKSGDFNELKTFAISDTIGMISDDISDKPLYGSGAKSVLSNISSQFTSRGFTQVNKYSSPDFIVNTCAIKTLNNVVTYYPGYWYDYGGYYDSGYWGYPDYGFYYPWTYSYTYKTGSLVIEVIDVKHRNTSSNKMKVIWMCLLNGYLDTEISSSTVNTYVNKGFQQSTYIQAN